MLKNGISIIVCCYNSIERIERTLLAIKQQNIDNIEVILVDNNSTDNTVELSQKLWGQFDKFPLIIVLEKRQGLSFARKAGVKQAKYKYILFCDDDNTLKHNYANNAMQIMENDLKLGALCGRNIAIYEKEPQAWVKNFEEAFACGYNDMDSCYLEERKVPWGAGLILRKSFLDKMENQKFESLLSDRKGKELSSGGDTEICYLLKLCGYKWRYDTRLELEHYIPIDRCNIEYLKKLFYGFGKADAVIDIYYKYGNIKRVFGEAPHWVKVYLSQKLYFIKRAHPENSIEKVLQKEFRKGFMQQLWNDKYVYKKRLKYVKSIVSSINLNA